MEQSESIAELAKALAAFQKKLKPIKKECVVKVKMKENKGTYTYTYADKAAILNIILPMMTAEGLSLQQCMGVRDDKPGIYTQVNHESGEWQRIFSPINPDMADVKDVGSWNTYISRYALSFVGVVTDDNDPDRQDITQAKEDAVGRGKTKKETAPKDKPKDKPFNPIEAHDKIMALVKKEGLEQRFPDFNTIASSAVLDDVMQIKVDDYKKMSYENALKIHDYVAGWKEAKDV